jgi:MFS family permease
MAHGTIFGVGAIYASHVLLDVKSISIFMACFLVGGLITQWPIGYISDRVSRRLVMAVISIVAIVGCMAAIALPKGSSVFFVSVALVGGAAMPMYSICIAYANDRLEPHQIVAASGSLVMVSGIGLSTGPIIISFFMDLYDVTLFFWGIAAIFGLILLFTLIRIQSRAGLDVKDQSQLIASGSIGTPIAEYNAPDAVDYAEAVANDELEKLDEAEEFQEDLSKEL